MPATPRKSRKSAAARKADASAALVRDCLAAVAGISGQPAADAILAPLQTGSALPFAPDSTDSYGAMPADRKAEVAAAVAASKAAGASGNELRATFGVRLSGPARRKLLREHSLATASTIAPSYVAYRDGESRSGTRHASQHGARAEARKAEARAAAEAELAAARKAPKGRSKASKAEHAARLAAAEALVAALA